MSVVRLESVNKSFGANRVLAGLDWEVSQGAFAVLFGGSSSGKTTVLRIIAGLDRPDSGRVLLRGQDAAGLDPAACRLTYVAQSFALMPHLRVKDNIGYPLRLAGRPRAEIEGVVREVADRLNIGPLLDRRPNDLSGGEKQRVAIARGMVKQADLYLLDEPLTGLDFKLRERLMIDLRRMQEELGATFVYATSDPIEALLLADSIAVLAQGRVVDEGPSERLYHDPRHLATVRGLRYPRANVIPGRLDGQGGAAELTTGLFCLRCDLLAPSSFLSRPVSVSFGAEALRAATAAGGDGEPDSVDLGAHVLMREHVGAEEILHLTSGGASLQAIFPAGAVAVPDGQELALRLGAHDVFVFDEATGKAVARGARFHE